MPKRSLIDAIEIKSPCSQNWDEMKGGEKIRFCEHCALEVNNLSEMTRKQALKLVRRSGGRLCVRYVKNPSTGQPLFADKFYRITRRAGIAAGVLGASLSLSTLAYAQGSPVLLKRNPDSQTEILREKETEKETSESTLGTISGTVADENGAVIPGATVTLTGLEFDFSRAVKTNEEGFYEFKDIAPGKYKLESESNGFTRNVTELSLTGNEEAVANVVLEVGLVTVTLGGIGIVEYSNPLHTAVSNDDLEEVRDLISRGENVNLRDENYNRITPLFIAVENGNAEIVQTLLAFGAKANLRDEEKQTPLMRIDEDASPELVSILIKHGAKTNLVDKEGNTALMLAARSAKAEVLEILLKEGASLDAQNKAGRTALMEAADADNLENVRALLRAGADAGLKDKSGETAWDLTTDEEIEKLLESYGGAPEEDSN